MAFPTIGMIQEDGERVNEEVGFFRRLRRRQIAVYRQLDDSSDRPGAIGAGPLTSRLVRRRSSRNCASCSFIYALPLEVADFASNSLLISAWSYRMSVVRPYFASSRATVVCFSTSTGLPCLHGLAEAPSPAPPSSA